MARASFWKLRQSPPELSLNGLRSKPAVEDSIASLATSCLPDLLCPLDIGSLGPILTFSLIPFSIFGAAFCTLCLKFALSRHITYLPQPVRATTFGRRFRSHFIRSARLPPPLPNERGATSTNHPHSTPQRLLLHATSQKFATELRLLETTISTSPSRDSTG